MEWQRDGVQQCQQGSAAPAARNFTHYRGLTSLIDIHPRRHGWNADESPGRRANPRSTGPLTRVAAPSMLRTVRSAAEGPQEPRTDAVRQPRGDTA
jgi:hypothetical protein